jgi:hypothetical protein
MRRASSGRCGSDIVVVVVGVGMVERKLARRVVTD